MLNQDILEKFDRCEKTADMPSKNWSSDIVVWLNNNVKYSFEIDSTLFWNRTITDLDITHIIFKYLLLHNDEEFNLENIQNHTIDECRKFPVTWSAGT